MWGDIVAKRKDGRASWFKVFLHQKPLYLDICDDEDMRIYSDIFRINAEIKSHSVIKQKYLRD